jgi:Arm DNA-binding domain
MKKPAKAGPDEGPNRMKLTKAMLEERRRVQPDRQQVLWDTDTTGLQVLISRGPTHRQQATLTFRVAYYLPDTPGRARYLKLGRFPDLSIEDARKRARRIRDDASDGVNPKRPKLTGNVKEVVQRYIDEYAKLHQRSWEETQRILNLYVVEKWADKKIEALDWKEDISPHLGDLAQGRYREPDGRRLGTKSVARSVRSHLVSLFNWYTDEYGSKGFRSPIVKSVKTRQWKTPARERFLEDSEIRVLWLACNELNDAYGATVQTALLTAQRFRKVGQMRRSELKDFIRIPDRIENGKMIPHEDVPNVWDGAHPNEPKNKRVSAVPLPELARKIIGKVPRVDADRGTDHIFTTTGRGPLRGWSKYKRRLDRKMLDIMQREAKARGDNPANVALAPWQHRDLRRTARTLMARCGVSNEVAEHCLAHTLPTIQATYNRHDYLREKRTAFAALADWVERIVQAPQRARKAG